MKQRLLLVRPGKNPFTLDHFALLFLLLLFFPLAGRTQQVSDRIDRYLSEKRPRNTFNGTALIVYKDKVLLFKGYGFRNVSTGESADTGTIYRIGSLSKPFTAIGVMRLVQEKRLSLQDPINKFISDFPHGEQITVEELLDHSSGVTDYLTIKAIQNMPDGAPPIALDTLIGYFRDEPLTMKPGKTFAYSNSNYILLAKIIEKVSGMKFETYMRKYVFDPMGLSTTGFDFLHLRTTEKAEGYEKNKNGFTDVKDFDSSYAPGCGSVYSNARDLYRFYRGVVDHRVLDAATTREMVTAHKWLYGYGWFIYRLYEKRCISHAGGVPGYVSNLQFFPDNDLCIVLLSNKDGGDMVGLSDQIAGIVFGRKAQSCGL